MTMWTRWVPELSIFRWFQVLEGQHTWHRPITGRLVNSHIYTNTKDKCYGAFQRVYWSIDPKRSFFVEICSILPIRWLSLVYLQVSFAFTKGFNNHLWQFVNRKFMNDPTFQIGFWVIYVGHLLFWDYERYLWATKPVKWAGIQRLFFCSWIHTSCQNQWSMCVRKSIWRPLSLANFISLFNLRFASYILHFFLVLI